MKLAEVPAYRAEVAASVRAELARADIHANGLPRLIGKSQSYWSRRLTGEVAFDVDDLASIANLLGVDVGRFLPAGTPVVVKLPRMDSNHQPAGYLHAVSDRYLGNPKDGVNLPPAMSDFRLNRPA